MSPWIPAGDGALRMRPYLLKRISYEMGNTARG
jgi:hypothetical protein